MSETSFVPASPITGLAKPSGKQFLQHCCLLFWQSSMLILEEKKKKVKKKKKSTNYL